MVDRMRNLTASLEAWSRQHRSARISRRAMAGFLAHDALQYAGSMAYFGVLSIFQLLVFAIVIGSLIVGEGQARDFVLEQVSAGSPLPADTVGGVIDAVIESRGSMTIISAAFLLWGALGVFSALSTGIGRAFEAAPPRPFIADKLLGLFLMAVTGVLAVASVAIGLVTGVLQEAAGEVIGDLPGGSTGVWLIGLAAPIILIFLAFWIIYKVVPNRPLTFAEVWPGALVATILWTLLRFGFTWYATSIANYDSAFGPISTGVTLLVFLYFASVITLIGAEFACASALDKEVAPDSLLEVDPRLLPVPTAAAPQPVVVRPMRTRWLLVAAAAVIGVLAGRFSKRDEE
jgi:membrane protein